MNPNNGQDNTSNVTIDHTLLHTGSEWRELRATDQIEERLRRTERAQEEVPPNIGRSQAGQASGDANARRDQTTDPLCLSILGAQLSNARSVPKTAHQAVTPQDQSPDSNKKGPPDTGSMTRTGNRIRAGPTSGFENEGRGSQSTSTQAESNRQAAQSEESKNTQRINPLGPRDAVTVWPDNIEKSSILLSE